MTPPIGEPKLPPAQARSLLAAMPWWERGAVTAGGLGFARFAPGTWGSLPPCVAVALLVVGLPAGSAWIIEAVLAALLLASSAACVRWGARAESLLGLKDPSCVVADEVAGMALSLLGLRWHLRAEGDPAWWWKNVALLGGAFLLFRALDVLKPPPCRQIQAMRGGWGILMDDIIAGVYASVALHLAMPANW